MVGIGSRRILVAALVAVGVGSTVFVPGALAGCGGSPTQIGTATGNPEADTFGLNCTAPDAVSPSQRGGSGERAVVQIGPSTGNPEKDTFGLAE